MATIGNASEGMADDTFEGISGTPVSLTHTELSEAAQKEYAKLIPEALVRKIMLSNLAGQGIRQTRWKRILQPREQDLPSPFALQDSKEAANLFIDAMDHLGPKQKIAIWGDYDADGNTSSAELGNLARQMRPDAENYIEHYIPYRTEGYGLNIAGIDALAAKGVTTLFTVDTGTVAKDQIAHARALGMKVAVLDHHQPSIGEALPKGALIVNPHRRDQKKPEALRDLAAAGVSWLFAQDVVETLKQRGEKERAEKIDLGLITVAATLGTIPDVVSVRSPLNRLIINKGLEEMNGGNYPVIEALKGLAGLKNITESNIAFLFGPFLNAAGRMGDPTIGMRMLLEKDPVKAQDLVKRLAADNDERKQFSNHIILKDALEKSQAFLDKNENASLLMVEDSHWLGGVVGIVASRLKEQYTLPTMVGAQWTGKDGTDYITYSARSIEGVDLFKTLSEAFKGLPKGDVVKFGGHAMAAGLTIRADAKDRVLAAMEAGLNAPVKEARSKIKVAVAGEIKPEDLTPETVKQFFQFGAYGAKISPPRLLVRDVQVKHVREMGDDGEHLRVSLGAHGASKPYAGLEFGTAFRARGTKLGELLQDPNRQNQAFDVVIEPYVFTKNSGEEVVGYHLVDASPARTVGQSPDPQQIIRAHNERLETFKAEQAAEEHRIASLPYKIERLSDLKLAEKEGKAEEIQALFKQLYDAKASFFDTETTGLDIGHPDYGKTNGLTQVAVAKIVKVGKNGSTHYELSSKLFPVLPFTPAYFEYLADVEKAKKHGAPKPAYDRARCEYFISPAASNITGIRFLRDGEDQPIKAMVVDGQEIRGAKPLYELGGEIAGFLDGTVPHAFNTSFDARGFVKQFGDVLAARNEPNPETSQLHTRISDDAVRAKYNQMTDPLAELIGEKLSYETPGTFSHIVLPANLCCNMLSAMLHKGEKESMRLDSVGPNYDVAFSRDDSGHNALEDILPLTYMSSQQLKYFAKKRYEKLVNPQFEHEHPEKAKALLQELESKPVTLRDLMEFVAQESDPHAKVETGFIYQEVKKKKAKKGKAEEAEEPEPKAFAVMKIGFSENRTGKDLPGLGLYLAGLATAKQRNSRIPELVLETGEHHVILDADMHDGKRIPLIDTYKKALCVNRLLASGAVKETRAFDSTGLIDIVLQNGTMIEDVPLTGLRKSLDFLLSDKAKPHLKEHLELLRWINDLPQSGLATLDEEGVTIRGLQRDFGNIRLMLPPNKSMTEMIPEIKAHTKNLLAIGSVPGALDTEYIVDEAESNEDAEKKKNASGFKLATQYHLATPNSVLMEVSTPLLTLIAQEKAYQKPGDHFIWPGGLVGQKAPAGDHYIINGTLESFEEIGPQIRNASWLLHRFNQLPGIADRKTILHENGTLELFCDPQVTLETLWILERAHVPFKAERGRIEIAMPDLMHDAFHWYSEIHKEQKFVKDEAKKKDPLKPSEAMQAIHEKLMAGGITAVELGRTGDVFARVKDYPLVPVNMSPEIDPKTVETLMAEDHAKPDIKSVLFQQPDLINLKHHGLAIRLSQLHGVQKNYSHLVRAENGDCVLTPPLLAPLGDKDLLIEKFRDLSRAARSVHVNPLLDNLRDITQSDVMRPDHDEPRGVESPVTLDRLHHMSGELHRLIPRLNSLCGEIEPVKNATVSKTSAVDDETKRLEEQAELKQIIFRNVAEFHLLRNTLSEARAAGKLKEMDDKSYQEMQSVLQGYYESLSMAEFKRYRLELDGLQVVKSVERVKKALSKEEEIIASDPLYGPYKAHKEVSSAINKLWEDGKRYKRTLDFSDEIIACAASLRDWKKLEKVNKAVDLVHRLQNEQIEESLGKLKAEGGIENYKRQGDSWLFDTALLEKDADKWDTRLGEMQKGKEPIPKTPHLVFDASTIMTLLLGTEAVAQDKHAGYLGIVQDLMHAGAIKPVITGGVLAEILNSPVPLNIDDIFVRDAEGKATDIKYSSENRRHIRFRKDIPIEVDYPKWQQRLEVLKDLYNSGQAEFMETPTEKLYYDSIRTNEELRKSFADITKEFPEQMEHIHGKTELRSLTNEELKGFLLIPHKGEHHSEARQRFLNKMRATGIRQDMGEVSMADAVHSIHQRYGMRAPVFVVYEGDDVRGRLLRRVVYAEGKNYMAGPDFNKLEPEFKPFTKDRTYKDKPNDKFKSEHIQELGETNFVSTYGFLLRMMQTFKPHNGFVVSPEEHTHGLPQDIENAPTDSYIGSLRKVREHAGAAIGHPRVYDKIVDEPASELGLSPKHSKSVTDENTTGPWERYLATLEPEAIRNVANKHVTRRLENYENKLQYHEWQVDTTGKVIDHINQQLGNMKPALVDDILSPSAPASEMPVSTTERRPIKIEWDFTTPVKKKKEPFSHLQYVRPPYPKVVLHTDTSTADERALPLAREIMQEHIKTLADSTDETPRLRLPVTLRFKLQTMHKAERAKVVTDIAELVKKELGETPEAQAYALKYERMLQAMNLEARRAGERAG